MIAEFVCKICGKKFDTPSLAHAQEELDLMKAKLKELPTSQFYELRLTEEWK
jgi:hypothetical protein